MTFQYKKVIRIASHFFPMHLSFGDPAHAGEEDDDADDVDAKNASAAAGVLDFSVPGGRETTLTS